jgi:GDPmannose 4,6-dehydratase
VGQMNRALVLGASGQDGTYLSELLLDKGYRVHALYRSSDPGLSPGSSFPASLLSREEFLPLAGTVADAAFIQDTINTLSPDEIYYLSSNHELDFSLENYEKSRAVNLDGLSGALNALAKSSSPGRLFYASSSNIFFQTVFSPQSEDTPHAPGTLYGFLKSAAMSLVALYREKFGIHACSGILYNHESPRRKDFFLPKKIVSTAVAIKLGQKAKLQIGDLGAVRDWGYAGDFVRAMWMMLQAESPRDYVIGTGVTRSVEWVVDFVFSELGLDWREHVVRNPGLARPNDAQELKADITRIRAELGWEPATDFSDVLKIMIRHELDKLNV